MAGTAVGDVKSAARPLVKTLLTILLVIVAALIALGMHAVLPAKVDEARLDLVDQLHHGDGFGQRVVEMQLLVIYGESPVHLLEAGGFDPTFRRAEDVELAYRLADRGLQFAFEPAAVGYHYAERSFDSWLATARAYGRNAVVFARDAGHPYVLSWVIDEYPTRHGLVRLVTRACLLRPAATTAVTTILLGVARLSEAARRRSVASQALSGIYGLAYYNALAEELGGREQFWTTMQGRTA